MLYLPGGKRGDVMSYEYKVVPAPTRGLKAKGVKTAEDRFANALETTMNDLAADGWEYQRTDTLPCEQREGLMSKTTVYQNMLVFRRALPKAQTAAAPIAVEKPVPAPANPPVTKPEPALSAEPDQPKRRTGQQVTRPLAAPERVTPELKEELLKADRVNTPDKKPDVAAE